MRPVIVLFLLLFSFQASAQSPCGVPVQPHPSTPTGHALMTPGGPLIIFNPGFIQQVEMQGQMRNQPGWGAAMLRYLLAHECGHHQLGHVMAGMANPYAMAWLTPQIELQADCHAGKLLRQMNDQAAVTIAVMMWGSMGMAPTGPNYPSGFERAQMLRNCSGW